MAGDPILVLGLGGQVGTELLRQGGDGLFAPSIEELDITDPASIAAAIASRPWKAVINAAAYTAVDKAETDVALCWAINAMGPAVLAAESAKAGIPILHISTDYVFDGSADGYYREDHPVRPLGVYGASKEGGEQAVRTANPRHAILRTAWLVSAHGNNFVKTMLRVGAERPQLRVVDDQRGCPTSAADLAGALLTITDRLIADQAAPTGTWHFVNSGEATWCEFARAIFADGAARGGPSPEVEAITTADYPTPAHRPANSRLSTAGLTSAYGITPRPWREALGDILDELL